VSWFLVTIQDKTLYGEPDVAIAVVDAPDEGAARLAARPTIEQLADAGRGRCVPYAREIEPGKFYRLGALVRLPRDPSVRSSMADLKKKLPDVLCPHCGHTDTIPLRNYGRPIGGDAPDTSWWQCLECRRQFDGPEVRR